MPDPLGISQPSRPAAAAQVRRREGAGRESVGARAPSPALNPNHPSHRIAAPVMTIGTLCGMNEREPNPLRAPMYSTAASAAAPALMWTTVPPAKSIAPSPAAPSHPSAKTQCATGAYTRIDQRPRNRT